MDRQPLRNCTAGNALGEAGGPSASAGATDRRQTNPAGQHDPADFVIEPLYVLPQDGNDDGLAADGTIEKSISAMQRWFVAQTGRRLRFRAGPVATVRVAESDAEIAETGEFVRDRLEELLHDEGHHDPHRIYAVWYDGTSNTSCGGGAWPPELVGHVAALYLRGQVGDADCANDRFSSDGVNPEINEFKMLHEIMHTLGFVSERAPHHTLRGHVSGDPSDLMWAAPTTPPHWQPSVLDVGHDDYYLTGSRHMLDLSRSIFLEPPPPDASPPPGWR